MNTYRIVNIIQNSVEWHSWRKWKIGASMAGTIMGENPYESALSLWERLIENREVEENENMKRGREGEVKVRFLMNGSIPDGPYMPVCMESLHNPWMIASLDGWSNIKKPHILEIKCPQKAHKEVPVYYKAQLQHQMVVAGVDSCLYVSYDGEQLYPILVEKDHEYCENLIEKEREFYDCLINFKPPEATIRDFRIVEIPNQLGVVSRYREIERLQEELEKEKQELRQYMISKCDHPRVMIGDLKLQKILRKGAVDYSKIEALKGIDLEKYRKSNLETWRIS